MHDLICVNRAINTAGIIAAAVMWRPGTAGTISVLRKVTLLRKGTRNQSALAFSSIAARSRLMSSGESCGRSTLIVGLLSLAVSGNGGL
jgi:hypothetical protein